MQRRLEYKRRSEDEEIKDSGLTIDLDEIARKGAMSKEEKSIAKWYGIYGSRQPGNHMARVVIPGGVITTTQARNIAEASENYGQGILNVTTRQAIQLHWLKVKRLADLMRDLGKDGNTTFHGCGDVTRNVAACPLAETCKFARLNVLPYAQQAAAFLSSCRDLDNLPRKFKITFSGCEAGCAQPYMNCVGNIGVKRKINGEIKTGFKVVIGGGMGWKAFVSQEVFSFVPADKIVMTQRAIALLFRDYGDRFNRAKARLKWVVHRMGIDRCRSIILENLQDEGVDTSDFSWEKMEEVGGPISKRPLTAEDPVGTDGKVTVRAQVPKGELRYTQLLDLANLADRYGNQRIYTTNRQNLELNGIKPEDVEEVKSKIKEMGFGIDGFFGLRDIVSCVGTTYCPKAVGTTRELYDALVTVVNQEKYRTIEKQAYINITGCPNSCSPYRISDIGFRGARIREELGSVEGYEMLIGGDEQKHGQKLGDFKMQDCVEITEIILDHFQKIRKDDETLTDTVNRVGLDAFKEVVFNEV